MVLRDLMRGGSVERENRRAERRRPGSAISLSALPPPHFQGGHRGAGFWYAGNGGSQDDRHRVGFHGGTIRKDWPSLRLSCGRQ